MATKTRNMSTAPGDRLTEDLAARTELIEALARASAASEGRLVELQAELAETRRRLADTEVERLRLRERQLVAEIENSAMVAQADVGRVARQLADNVPPAVRAAWSRQRTEWIRLREAIQARGQTVAVKKDDLVTSSRYQRFEAHAELAEVEREWDRLNKHVPILVEMVGRLDHFVPYQLDPGQALRDVVSAYHKAVEALP